MTDKEKLSGVLERRGAFLAATRQMTFEAGHFTTADLATAVNIPRSTANDWINRLMKEGCIFLKEEPGAEIPHSTPPEVHSRKPPANEYSPLSTGATWRYSTNASPADAQGFVNSITEKPAELPSRSPATG